jgi:hypothetical protein
MHRHNIPVPLLLQGFFCRIQLEVVGSATRNIGQIAPKIIKEVICVLKNCVLC